MSFMDMSNVHPLADSGAYGGIPYDLMLRTMEQTPIYEDENQVEDYMRRQMKDYRPDAPFLASDAPRDPNDRGGGNHSVERMNLRHGGARSLEDPYLPDGSFLDWEFTDKDPRGIATDPDMRKHYEQQMARAAFIKFYDDNDYSVPETGVNPVQMVANKEAGFYQFKDRYQNFEESFDAWHNGGTAQSTRTGSDVAKCTMDGTVMDLVDSTQRNRGDAVDRLSRDPTIAFRHSTVDHRVKIAKYGMVRASQDKSYQNWSNNRGSSFLDHANMAVINGERTNRMLANLIIDLEGLRATKQEVAQGATYGDSAVQQQRSKKMQPDDIYKILMIGGNVSHGQSANEAFEGKRIARYGSMPKNNNRVLIEQIQINHEIVKSMEQATRRIASNEGKEFRDLRKNIEQSASDRGVYREAFNRRLGPNVSKTINETRNAEYTQHVEDGKEVKQYGGIKPSKYRNPTNDLEWERFGSHSRNTLNRKGRREGYKIKDVDDFEQDTDQNRLTFGVFDRATRADAREHMGRGIQHDMDFGDIETDETIHEMGDMDL